LPPEALNNDNKYGSCTMPPDGRGALLCKGLLQ
jgi:hypothetical protein